ncbi:hypothetical protein ACOSP7_015567 [Xanthoceras sorbifolium]
MTSLLTELTNHHMIFFQYWGIQIVKVIVVPLIVAGIGRSLTLVVSIILENFLSVVIVIPIIGRGKRSCICSNVAKISSRAKFITFEKGFMFDEFVMKLIKTNQCISCPDSSSNFFKLRP